MNSRDHDLKKPAEPTGIGPGVLAAMAALMALFVGGAWYFRTKPAPSAPPPAPETAVEEAAPALAKPANVARAQPRDFSKRRGAPHRTAPVAVASHTNNPPVRALSIEEKYGIRVLALRLMMANRYLDMRYRVVDSAKAAQLSNGQTPSFLMDRASGTRLLMPKPPAEGAFPPTSSLLATNRAYFSMILNPGGAITSGSQVELLVGNTQPMKLVVQ